MTRLRARETDKGVRIEIDARDGWELVTFLNDENADRLRGELRAALDL